MTVLAEIGAYLDTTFASIVAGTSLFYGAMPEEPDTCVALAVSPGGKPQFMMGASDGVAQLPAWEPHRVQVKVRTANAATSYTDSETLAWSLYRAMSLTNVTLGSVRYLMIEPVAVPAPLEEDKRGRVLFVFNLDCLREPGGAGVQ